jgi:hypothetical protein
MTNETIMLLMLLGGCIVLAGPVFIGDFLEWRKRHRQNRRCI